MFIQVQVSLESLTAKYAKYAKTGDGYELPDTWEGKMDAIVNGRLDHGDCKGLAIACATIADRIMPRCDWTERIPTIVTRLLAELQVDPQRGYDGENTYYLWWCGRQADKAVAASVITA